MAVAGSGARALPAARLTVPAALLAYGLLAATRLPPSSPLVTTYGAASPVAHAAGLVAGLLLLTAGAVAVWWGPSRVAGALLAGAGVLWFAPDWAGWEGGPGLVRGLATLLIPFLPVLLLGLLATRLGHPRARQASLAVAGVAGVLTVGFVAVDDPFLDPHCWPTCSSTPLLVSSNPELAELLRWALAATWTGVAAAAAVGAIRWLASASSVARRWDGALLVAIGAVGAVETGYGTALLTRVENAGDAVFAGLYLSRAGAWSILAVASVWVTARHVARHRALAGLAAELETAAEPGSLAATLRAVTGDPDLEVLYPVGRDGRHVGADGRSASATTASGRTATPLRRGAETVAVLWHDPTVLPVDALDQVLGSAARLALENERLAAERLARMHDVQESRHRIVATGDEARRRLERDLHDGAQQSLLALSYMLRLARASADRTGQTVVVAELDRGLVQTQSALDDLRDLAHGIHPAVLSEAGLAAALRSLAERSAVPLELAAVTAERFTASIELAVYAVVRDAAERADPERTAALAVRVGREDGLLVVHVDGHDGRVPAEIADRLGALAGEVRTTADGIRVVLPCAS